MDMRKVQHEAMVEDWKKIIIECRNSGLSAKQWCRQNNVKENRYYYWLNVIRNEAMLQKQQHSKDTAMTVFAEIKGPGANNQLPATTSSVCAVIHLSGLEVEIYNGAAQSTISAIVKTLKESC
jgi:putative transposase